jgi:hypothetical protein
LFSMPKYSVLMENGDILGYAQWFYKTRIGQYNHNRVARQLAVATRYMWKPSIFQEAEYAAYQGCNWSNERPGYTGTGYVAFENKPGSYIEWETEIPNEGEYRLGFRYSLSGNADKTLQLTVSGVSQNSSLSFLHSDSGSWATNAVAVKLSAGHVKIRLTDAVSGGPDLDNLDVQPVEGAVKNNSTTGVSTAARADATSEAAGVSSGQPKAFSSLP